MWRPEFARELAGRHRAPCQEELVWDGRRWDLELERFERALEGWTLGGVR
jgi:hypothetical protein